MKLLLTIPLVLSLTAARAQIGGQNANNNVSNVPVYARVDPTGLTGNGTGIRGVTYTNLTQDTTAIVQSFFAGGGVALPANRQAQLATTASASPTALVHTGAKGVINYRGQLMSERMRLVQLIESKCRGRQSASHETAQVMAIERAIQQAERQIALRGFKEITTQGPGR
ncbi:MAG: hypothetical protein L0Z50_16995 [Verrucomicrobiales bacterium]|nr:hypothetical protein [Verrucomicrobiales bacterium]